MSWFITKSMRHYAVLAAIAAVCLVLTVAAFNWARGQAWEVMVQGFHRAGASNADVVADSLAQRLDELRAIARFFDASEEVSRQRFATFVQGLLGSEEGFKALMWVPRVPRGEHQAFENRASAELGVDYRIRGIAEHGGHGPAGGAHQHGAMVMPDHDYTPVLYVEPLQHNRSALGFDLSSEPVRRAVLERAAREARPVSSDRITLIHEGNDPTGFLIVMPVYPGGDVGPGNPTAVLPLGYVVGRMSARQVISAALKQRTLPNTVITLRDLADKPEEGVLFRLESSTADVAGQQGAEEVQVRFIRPVEFAGQYWQLLVEALPGYVDMNLAKGFLLVPPVGAILMVLIVLYVHTLRNQRERAEHAVNERTAALNDSRARLSEAQRIARIGSWELNHRSNALHWSEEVYRIFELDPEQFSPSYESLAQLLPKEDAALLSMAFSMHLQTGADYNLVHQLRMADGRIKFVHERCETEFAADGSPVMSLGTVQDITERKQAEDRVAFLAHHDVLTGLPNRIMFRERFEQAQAQARRDGHRVALVFLDLDRFKFINDSLGHQVGDVMLREVAARLLNTVRETDILGRQGGDEFLVAITDQVGLQTVATVVDKILQALRQPFVQEGHTLGISSSMGIAVYPDDGEDFDTLLRKADTAMYAAKDSGRDSYRFFTQQMNVDALDRLQLLGRMRKAIDEDEFVLFYQPQLDLRSGKLTGAEALMRWQPSSGDRIEPARFIPVAEESGLILPLGLWALRQSCRQLAEWHRAGHVDMTMAVNLSALQLRQQDIVEQVARAIRDAGIPPHSLELELTETVLLQDTGKMLDVVRALTGLGVGLVIDDFGTGYSSLSYLKRLNAKKLKIDRSFVKDIDVDRDSAAIVRAVIHMARDLEVRVIAEGVETPSQARFLGDLACESVQGFLYGRPMPAADFAALFDSAQ